MSNQTKFNLEGKTFEDVYAYLQIPEFSKRIFHSNSKGELFHIYDYVDIAKRWQGSTDLFRELFLYMVKDAEATWKRPDAVFQHVHQGIAIAAYMLNKKAELCECLGIPDYTIRLSCGTPAA